MKRCKTQEKMNIRNKGSSMVIAIVVIGILMVFVFALMLVTYTLYTSQNKNVASARNSYAANTLSQALETELQMEDAEASSDLYKYLRFNINQKSWPYYCPDADFDGHDEAAAFRYFDINYNYVEKYFSEETTDESGNITKGEKSDSLAGFPGSVKLCIYWRASEETEAKWIRDGLTNAPEPGDADFNISGARLYIDIICETASQSYVVTNKYILNVVDDYSDSKDNKNLMKTLDAFYKDSNMKDRLNPFGNTVEDLDQHWKWSFESRE